MKEPDPAFSFGKIIGEAIGKYPYSSFMVIIIISAVLGKLVRMAN